MSYQPRLLPQDTQAHQIIHKQERARLYPQGQSFKNECNKPMSASGDFWIPCPGRYEPSILDIYLGLGIDIRAYNEKEDKDTIALD